MSDGYSRVYRIGLLDDLHNYFPELLYNIESFNTVQDVLTYVRDRTAQRFNIFDNAAQRYSADRLNSSLRAATRQEPSAPLRAPSVVNLYRPRNDLSLLLSSLDLLSMERAAPRPPARIAATQNILNSLYEDVVVHASQPVIDRASNLRTLTADLEGNCSICQDQMKTGDSLRKLTGCNHEFHKACIDPWLLTRSVLCPSCRHDIRLEGMPAPSASPLPSASPAPIRSSINVENELQDDELIPAEEFISLLFPRRRF